MFPFRFLVLGLILAAPLLLAPAEAKISEVFEIRVLRLLKKKDFVRNTTCSQFSNLLLTQSGLPILGSPTLPRGSRGNLDRRFELQQPPLFIDNTTWSQTPYIEYSVQGKLGTYKGEWALVWSHIEDLIVARAPDEKTRRLSEKTVFLFDVGSADNAESCELSTITLDTAWVGDGKPSPTRTVLDAKACLALFDPNAPEEASDVLSRKVRGLSEIFCSLGLRYFRDVKDALSDGSLPF